jgi:hypothetical protein
MLTITVEGKHYQTCLCKTFGPVHEESREEFVPARRMSTRRQSTSGRPIRVVRPPVPCPVKARRDPTGPDLGASVHRNKKLPKSKLPEGWGPTDVAA